MKKTSIPHAANNTKYQIMRFPNNIVAVDYTNQTYFELSESELRSCTKTTNSTTWMCLPPAISKITENSTFIIDEIFQKHPCSPCPVIEMKVMGILWRKLKRSVVTQYELTFCCKESDCDENCRLETSYWIILIWVPARLNYVRLPQRKSVKI